ncbi:MAG: bifunctional adenosylcobinamide kinase/adenosylcobinamide-phosphate guanylyltransferase [Clostridia bacterium]|nr:bifunctional adenosylcobinamide kinase/adenosylcobinamide-phosphate guanylyltransferase [Clostridia bacterium]
MIYLITGGSGCGKSTWAEKLVESLPAGKRIYIATMQVYDRESEIRVQRHRAQRRRMGFRTIECEKNLAAAETDLESAVLLEDLVNLTANEMFDNGDPNRIVPALRNLAERCRHLIMVTNDLFSDGVIYSSSVQEYLRRLADINRQAAAMADCVIEVVYSIPVALKGEVPCL